MNAATAALTRIGATVTRLSTAVAGLRRRLDHIYHNPSHPLLQLTAALEDDVDQKRRILRMLQCMCSGAEPDFTNAALHERLIATWSEMPSFARVHHLHDVDTVVAIMDADLTLAHSRRQEVAHDHNKCPQLSSSPGYPPSEKPLSPALAMLKTKSARR